jgi:hypothetical protein
VELTVFEAKVFFQKTFASNSIYKNVFIKPRREKNNNFVVPIRVTWGEPDEGKLSRPSSEDEYPMAT